MAIVNLLNEQKRYEQSEGMKDAFKTAVAVGAIGGIGYGLNNYGNVTNNVKKALNNSSKVASDLSIAGSSLRADMETLDGLLRESKEKMLSSFKESMLSNDQLDDILKGGADVDVSERKALLASLFDSLKVELGEEDALVKEGLLERIKSDFQGKRTLESQDIDTIRNFYQANIAGNKDSLSRFRSTYNRYSQVRELLSSSPLDFGTRPATQVQFQQIDSLTGFSADKALNQKIEKRFSQIRGLVGAKNVSLETIDEFGSGSGVKSLYARINYGEGTVNIPLHLQRDARGMAFYRATSNLSTRYVAPLKVLNGLEVIKGGYGTANITNNALLDFEDFIFSEFIKKGRGLENLSSREINSFNSFLRTFGPDAPRAMASRINDTMGRGFISPELVENLASSRLMQASSIYISGIEEMGREDQSNIVNRLLRSNQGMFTGPGNQQTQLTRVESPFDRNQQRSFLQIGFLGDGNTRGYTSFTGLRAIGGRLDRGLLPQTARETQMFGRPEFLSSIQGLADQAFGYKKDVSFLLGFEFIHCFKMHRKWYIKKKEQSCK